LPDPSRSACPFGIGALLGLLIHGGSNGATERCRLARSKALDPGRQKAAGSVKVDDDNAGTVHRLDPHRHEDAGHGVVLIGDDKRG
jgi:hypothetical protein